MTELAKILLIDDEKRMCDSLTTLLEIEGYEVASFTDARAGAKMLEDAHFDLVITDIKMPGISGIEILKKAHEKDAHLEVILMTGYASLESAKEAVDQGAFSYLTKPVEFEELKIAVARSLEKRVIALEREKLMVELGQANMLLKRKLSEIDALYSAGTILATTIDLTEALTQILSLAIDVIGAKIGSVMILDPHKRELYIGAACGLSKEIVMNTKLRLGDSIAGYVAQTGKPLIVEDIEKDPRFSRLNRQHYELKSLISVPLKYKDKIYGVINLNNKVAGTAFDEDDLTVLTTFASQAAIAIDRANIFADRGEKINELSVLFDLTRQISTLDTTDKIGEIIFNQLRKLIKIESVAWYCLNERNSTYAMEFSYARAADPLKDCPPPELKINKEVIGSGGGVDIKYVKNDLMKWLADTCPDRRLTVEVIPVQSHGTVSDFMAIASKSELNDSDKNLAAVVANQAASVYDRQKAILNSMKLVTMGKMISEICHDLKKPLTNLKGDVQVYKGKIKGKEAADFFNSSEKELNRLHGLVMEMVDFANPNKYSTTRENLHDLVEKAAELLEKDLERKKIEFSLVQADNVPAVFINKNEIFEAILNIIQNAIESIDHGGKIEVGIRPHPAGEPYVQVAVADTGCGIPEKEQSRVFDRYYTTKEVGTGLGLAIVERVIEVHNGRLSLASEVGKGTTFTIELPV